MTISAFPCRRPFNVIGQKSIGQKSIGLSLLFGLFCLLFLHPVLAQENPSGHLEKIRSDIAAIERDVQQFSGDDGKLIGLKARLEPLNDQLRDFIGEQSPRLDGIKARLEQLGPKADASKGQTENADVTRQRDEQEKARSDVEGVLALARTHIVAVDQVSSTISDHRRTLLTKALLERSSSVFSPVLWLDVVRALPGEIQSAVSLASIWWSHILNRLDMLRLVMLAGFFVLMGILVVPGNAFLHRFEARPESVAAIDQNTTGKTSGATRLKRAMAALRVTLMWAIVPVIVCAAIYNFLDALGLIHYRVENVVRTLLFGIAFVAFAHGLADGVLGPDDPQWRLVNIDDASARRITRLASLFPAIIVAGKVVEALNQSIYAVLPVTVATKGVFALLGALAVVRTLQKLRDEEPVANPPIASANTADASDGAAVSNGTMQAVRLLGWAAVAAVVGAAGFGYVALASFLSDQIIWLAIIGTALLILLFLVDEIIGKQASPEGTFGKQIMHQVGLSQSSLKQISILSNGFLHLVLFIAATMFVLAPWGLDGGDTIGTIRAALFGFSVGGVTISLSNILIAIVLFALGFAITRGIKRWLEKSYLPHTKLDPGLRNSIATSIGYIGIIIAGMMAASAVGLSLDKFTLIAGALSVGIGFGLQSIINNFVSGLILLWERPIRVGDWIVVGDEQGLVKRINVRSTQIETFDRASLIVPNSEFISGRVKNWMHNDRLARIVIPIGVGYGSEPEQVKAILLDVARGNKAVMADPHPRVYFMKLGDSSMEFELRCFVDVDSMLPVKSELMFDLLKRLRKAHIDIPMPRRPQELLMPPADTPRVSEGEDMNLPGRSADKSRK
jgi:potassium-dependent mechanosensitive channel